MTKGQLRTTLRSWLRETTADEWTDGILDGYLDAAAQQVETEVLALRRDAITAVYRADLVLNQVYYDVPDDFLYEHEIRIANAASVSVLGVGAFRDAASTQRLPENRLRNISVQVGDWHYARTGNVIHIEPIPSVTVANGLILVYTPAVVLGTSDTRPFSKLPLPLHPAIVAMAAIIARGPTTEASKETKAFYDTIISRLPLWYLTTADEQVPFSAEDAGY